MNKEKEIYLSDKPISEFEDLFGQLSPMQQDHSHRVAHCSKIIFDEFQRVIKLPADVLEQCSPEIMYFGCMCHDIGKLLLTPKEEETDYKRHPELGVKLLKKHKSVVFDSDIEMRTVLEIVKSHHEQPDGKGYPDGLSGEDIPLHVAICCVANKLDHFLFQENMSKNKTDDVLKHFENNGGTVFFDSIVYILGHIWVDILDAYRKWIIK